MTKKGQFGSTLLDILFWLFIIGMIAWILKLYLSGSIDNMFSPAQTLIK